MGWLGKRKIRLFQEQRGISLIETLVSLVLLGIVGVALLNGLSTSSKAVIVSQEDVAAESLANSQVEYIKTQDYIPVAKYGTGTPPKYYQKITIPADLASRGYSIDISTPATIIPPTLGPFELQSIKVVIKHNGQGALTISVYKCGSSL
jgi:type II secretory pathway pseudopilin PulG